MLTLDDILLIGTIWQKQVESIISTDKIVNIDLIRQQIILAQYIPLNLNEGVDKLNGLIDKVAMHILETRNVPIPDLTLK